MTQIVLRAPIQFVAQTGEPVHAPMVLATVGASHTRLILDTGSDVHPITRELAEAAGRPAGDARPRRPPGTVVALGPDTFQPVLWQVATLH